VLRLGEPWLGTRALTGDKAPDAKLFPTYAADEELRSDIRLQPVRIDKEKHLVKVLEFYMGKNTPDRQDFIIDNLRIEMDEVEKVEEAHVEEA